MLTFAAMLALSATPLAPAPTACTIQDPAPQEAPKVYDETADGAAQIAAALAVAQRDNTRVLVQWGANWCGWCIKLDATLKSDKDLAREVLYEYEVVHVDIGKWDKHLALVEKYGADIKEHGVPFWTILDGDGKVLANQATGPLEKGDAHDPQKVLAVLKQHEAPYAKAQDLLDAALARVQAADKRLWVSFGAPWCGWCHRLEGWVRTEPAATLLAQDFEFLKIDVDRTVGGKELLARYRGPMEGGIPWFVFLEADGAVLADSGKGGENLGCPWTDEELARFHDILAKVCRRLDGEARTKLVDSLRAARTKSEAEAAARRAERERKEQDGR